MKIRSETTTRDLCREFRINQTKSEALLWKSLRNRGLDGLKFRRQYPCEGFILDFYCAEIKLGIELDGEAHREENQRSLDEDRTCFLEENGIKIIRFWNTEVIINLPGVLRRIQEIAKSSPGE